MADEQIVTSIVANADFSNLISDLNKVTVALGRMQAGLKSTERGLINQIRAANTQFGDTLRSTGQFSSHFVTISSDVDKFGKSLDSGRMKLGQYFKVWQEHHRTAGGLVRDLAKQQVQMQNSILQPLGKNAEGMMRFAVHVPKGLDLIKNKTAITRQELAIMNKVIQDGANQLINWGKNTQWAGRQLTVGLTVPLVAFGKAAADAFRAADEELVRLTKVYGDLSKSSTETLLQVRKDVTATARELSTSMGVSFKDTIALAADIAATGKTGNELLASVSETTRLAVLGEVDRQEAMKATLAIQTAFKQNSEQLAESINFLNAVENQTSTTLNDLVEAIPRAGTVVKGLGGSVQDLALYLTAMREGGVTAAEGANALKSALASLINPTDVAIKKFQGFGIDLEGIVTQNAGNLTGTILKLQSALDTLDPLSKQQAIEQLFGKFQFARLNALFENLNKQGSQTVQVLNLMKASSADLANIAGRELEQVTESASGKYRRAIETLRADLATTGEQFLGIATKVVNAIDKVINIMNNMPEPLKKLLGIAGGFTALVGPVIMLTGVLGNFFGYIVKGIYHFKALFKGAEGWKLLTPEIMAANNAASLIEKTFYSDAKAAEVLKLAILDLTAQYEALGRAASTAAIGTGSVSTVAGNPVVTNIYREVDPSHPLAGREGTRSFAHMVPRRVDQPESIFGVNPSSGPVNALIRANPMIYAEGDLPNIPGLTTISGNITMPDKTVVPMSASTGVVAHEAARHQALIGALAMQSKEEVKIIEKMLDTTGTATTDFMATFDDILPITTQLSQKAATQSAQIVAEVQAGKISVEQARRKIIELNIMIEQEMVETLGVYASQRGLPFDPYTVPLLSQPATTPTGQTNMREIFKKEKPRSIFSRLANIFRVRTSGAGYNIETTRPKKFQTGGQVPYTLSDGPIVPGPSTDTTDTQFGLLPPDTFIVNKNATANNIEFLSSMVGGTAKMNDGGSLQPVMLTPEEFAVPPHIVNQGNNLSLLEDINAGRITMRRTGGIVPMMQKFAALNPIRRVRKIVTPRVELAQLARAYVSNKSGLTKSEKDQIIAASNELTGLSKKSWPKAVERAHMVEPVDVLVNGKNFDFHPGLMFIQSRKKNQATKSSGRGATGQQIVDDFNDLIDSKGIHPAALLFRNAKNLGYADSDKTIIAAYNEIIKVLSSAKYRDMTIGGRNGEVTLESITGPILKKHLKTLRGVGGGRNFFDDVFHQGGIRGKSGKTEDIVDLEGYRFGGRIRGLNGGGRFSFLGIPRGIKSVARDRAIAEEIDARVRSSRFRRVKPTDYGHQVSPSSGHSFPIPGIGGVYRKPNGDMVFVKPMIDEKSALAELRATVIAREAHGLNSPKQTIRTMIDPNDPARKRRIIVLESPYDPAFAGGGSKFTRKQYFQQLVASLVRGDKDLSESNVFGGTLADVGTAGVFGRASGKREFAFGMNSMLDQAMINLLGVKGGARKAFAQNTVSLIRNMGPQAYHRAMIDEIDRVLPKLKETVKTFKLSKIEKSMYDRMIKRLEDGRNEDWTKAYDVHRQVKPATKNLGGSVRGYSGGGKVVGGMQYKNLGGILKAIWTTIRGAMSKGKKGAMPVGPAQQLELDLPGVTTSLPAAPIIAPVDMAAQEAKFSPFGFRGQAMGMAGSVAGSMIGNSVAGMPGMMIGGMIGNMAMFLPQLMKAKGLAMGIGQILSKLFIPAAVISTLLLVGKYLLDLKKKAEDLGKANRLAFGGTKESFASVGIKNYESLSDRIKDINEKLELHRATVKSVYESYTKTGVTGLSLTIEELRKAIKNAKENQKDYVNAFNDIDSTRVVEYAAQLKSQFLAMGMSAQEATNQIYAIIKASEKAGQAFSAITSSQFTSLQDTLSGIEFVVKTLSKTLSDSFNAEEFNRGLDTLLNSVLLYRDSLVGAADDQKNIRDEADATAETLDKISKIKGSDREMSADQVEQLKAQNLVYGGILGKVETLESITAKILLYSSGLAQIVDLGKMSAQNAIDLARNFATVQNIMNSVTEDIQKDKFRNSIEPLAKVIDKVKRDSETATEAVKKLKKVDEEYYRDKMKAIDDLIKKLQKEREARLKLIDTQERAATFENQLKSAQIKYQQALTAGNLAQAAQEQLNIQQLSTDRQRQLTRDAINEKYDKEISKLEDQKDKLQKELDDANKNYNSKTAAATAKAAELAKLQSYRDELEQIALRNINGSINKTDAMRIENIMKEMTDAGGELAKAAAGIRAGNPAVAAVPRQSAGKSFAQVLVDNLNADVKSRSAENITFKTAVDKFAQAVKDFAGDSTIGAAPKEGEFNKRRLSVDDSYLHFESASGKKYLIKVKSTRYDDTFQTVKDLGGKPIAWSKVRRKGYIDLGTQGEDGELKDQKLATGGAVKGYSKAGEIVGQGGTGTSDDILIRASRGEFMINANSAASAGMENMHSINQKGADGIIEAAMRLLSGSKFNKGGSTATQQQLAKLNKSLSYYDKNIDPKFESFAKISANLFANSPAGMLLPALHIAKDVFGSWFMGSKPTFGKRGIAKDFDPRTYIPYLEAFNMSMLHPFAEISKGSATKGDWINAALFMVPQSKAGTGLSAASRIQMGKSGAFAALSTKRYKDFVKSIYQTKYIEHEGFKYPTHTLGDDSTRFGFEGYGEDISDLLKSGKIDQIVKTTPEGILEAALKLNPKSKEIKSMLANFRNKNITQKEIDFLDQMTAAVSVNNRGKLTQMEQGEGFAMLLSALKGNTDAAEIIKMKTAMSKDLIAKQKEANKAKLAESNKGFRIEDGPVEPDQVPVIHSTKYPVVRDKDGNIVLHTYGDHNIGTSNAYPRASLHFTLEDTVKSHMQGQWDSAQNKIVSRLSTMIDDSGLPYQLNSTDTWWMRNPGQPLRISDASVIKPFTSYSSYADELVSRGLIKAGDAAPIISVDPKTKEILHLIKENYTDADRIKIAELQGYSAGYAERLVGKEADAIEETALQLAKKQLGIETSAVKLEQHSLSSSSRQNHIYRIAKALGLSSEIHNGSRPYLLESMFSKSPFGPNRNTELASNKLGFTDTIEGIRMLAEHGYFKTLIKKIKSADDFDWFARGGYVKKFHDLRGPIPGPYNEEVGAIVRAKTESIYPTDYINSLQNGTMGGNTYVLKNEINAPEGMDVNQLADVVTRRTLDTIKSIDKLSMKASGENRKFGGAIVV